MNLSILQLFGVIIGVFFCYNSYVQYKKGVFRKSDFWTWILIWGGLVAVSFVSAFFFPLTTTIILSYNLLDTVTATSVTVLFGVCFSLYKKSKVQELKLKRVVKKIAFDE